MRWGQFSYRHRRLIPALVVLVILALYGIFGLRLGDRLSQEGWEDPGADSTVGARIEQETFGRDRSGDVIALYSTQAPRSLSDPALAREIDAQLQDLQARYPGQIDHVTSYFSTTAPEMITADGTRAFAAIGLAGDGEQTLKDYRVIEDALRDQSLPEGVSLQIAGATAVADSLDEGMAGDISRAELVALPVVAVLLLVVFGSVVAATMPLIVGLLSILGSLGILSILAGTAQVNVFAQSVVTLLGLGLAIDYGLFMVSRFREEMDASTPLPRAVAVTTATAGKTVVFSAAMVAVALSGLMIFPQAFLKSVAYGAISAVGLAALLSVTVLPALFGLLGHNIDRWALRRTSRRGRRLEDTLWWRLPAWAMRHAKAVTVVITGALVALAIPLAGMTFGGINETYLPPTNPTRQAQAAFDETFPAFRTEPIKLVVTGADNQQLSAVYRQANEVEGLTGRFRPAHPSQDGTTVLTAGIRDREDNQEVIERLRTIDAPEGVTVHIAGTPAMEVESIEALLGTLPWMALYMVLATFLLMALVFGSFVLPAKAIIMTILGLGSTLGILTLMFVDGVGSGALNFSAGPLMSPVLVLIVAIVYGLSTDYEVFLVSRMVEARDRGARTDTAITYGTAHTGGIITAAALIMIVVAGAFGFSEIVMMKYIAFGMIAALLIDATVIRMLLVPAVMHLLREDNWWAPAWLRAAYDRLGHGIPVPAPRPQPAAPTTAPVSVDEAVVIEESEAARGGRTTAQDTGLVPFKDLIRKLEK
nr:MULTISPECIES: MMPL family transporter [unclassified Corynebacterium]